MEQGASTDLLAELVFLRQMVHRLNAALSKYQGNDALKLDDRDEEMLQGFSTAVSAPWLTNPSLLSPLITEYESHMSTLVSQVSLLQKENQTASDKLKILNEENQRLHLELKEIVESKLQEVDCTDSSPPRDDVLLRNMQSQLELAYSEKDAAAEMNKETMKLLDKIRHEKLADVSNIRSRERLLDETKSRNEQLENDNLQMQALLETLQRENKAFSTTTTQQLNELKSCQNQIQELKKQLRDSRGQEDELKKVLASLNQNLSVIEKEKAEVLHISQVLQTQKKQLETSLADAERRLAYTLQTESDLHAQLNAAKIQVTVLEKQNAEIEAKEMNHHVQIRESAQMLDDALLARDSALIREKQKQEDLEKSATAMEILVKEIADSVKKEVDKANTSSNAKLQYLQDEITTMELEIANLKSEANRAKREKRNVEEELDLLTRRKANDSDRPSVEEFQRRAINAERARDDALISIQSLQDRVKQLKMEQEEERLRMTALNQSLEQRVKQLSSEAREKEQERMHLIETVNQCKHEVQRLEKEARTARLDAMKEFTAAKSIIEREKKQLQTRLKSVDETNGNSVRKLHKLLIDQQRVNARWREETKSSIEQYESKIKDLQAQLSQNKYKCRDLTNKLQMTVQGFHSSSSKVPQLEDSNRLLRSQLRATQDKLLDATQKLGEVQNLKTSLTMQDLY